MKITLLIIAIAAAGFMFRKDIARAVSPGHQTEEKLTAYDDSHKNKKGKQGHIPPSEINILERWDLPADLKEVSGIAYIDAQRFACVQDEEGKIFIFNSSTNKIEREIVFGSAGDYEGIAVNGNIAYVLRADGKLFEVNMKANSGLAKQFSTGLTAEHNVEGLSFDKENNRLLLAIKNVEPGNPGYKGIYAFDLSNNQFIKDPVFKIDLGNELLNNTAGKKGKSIMPSEIGVHPATGEIFITDGPKARLLVMDNLGNIKKLWQLGKEFAQPEGLTFSPAGELFISNEGTKEPGNILKVALP